MLSEICIVVFDLLLNFVEVKAMKCYYMSLVFLFFFLFKAFIRAEPFSTLFYRLSYFLFFCGFKSKIF